MNTNKEILLALASQNAHFHGENREWFVVTAKKDVKTKLGLAIKGGETSIAYRQTEAELEQYPEFVREKIRNSILFWSFRNGCLTGVPSSRFVVS